jgi:hypothetical protein
MKNKQMPWRQWLLFLFLLIAVYLLLGFHYYHDCRQNHKANTQINSGLAK